MPVFSYEAVDRNGKTVKGKEKSRSKENALRAIRGKGLKPVKIGVVKDTRKQAEGSGQKKKRSFSIGRGVSRQQLTQFTTQLATLQDAGLPIVKSLRILEEQQKPGRFKDILQEIADDVEGGSTFSEALAKHPRVFDVLYVSMVRAGEAGGVLDVILLRLASFQEKSLRLIKKVQGAMYYPIVVMIIAAVILTLIMIFVVPQFETMFEDQGGSLPAPTRLLMNMSETIGTYWYLIPSIPFAFWMLFKAIGKSEKGAYSLDAFKLRMPIFGSVMKKTIVARFCRTLGTLITSGVPILEALSIVKDAIGNRVISNAVESVHGSIREGDTIAEPLREGKIFDDIIINMISVGEETGELDKMLTKIADNYDTEVDIAVEGLSRILEPVIIVVLGGVVAFIVISLFLPLIGIIQQMGQ